MFIYMLLLEEGRAGEAWEPSNKTALFRLSGSIGKKSALMFVLPSQDEVLPLKSTRSTFVVLMLTVYIVMI
jgi:hypothetical protein